MKLIADSGSSKTAWRILREDGSIEQQITSGLNPYYISVEDMLSELNGSFLSKFQNEPVELYFYGSGCASAVMKQEMKNMFGQLLPGAVLSISDDLTAAARATCNREPGIACILGTGSNSCYYNGNEIEENIPSGGYILGDEGSGSYMGKVLLGDFITGNMPDKLRKLMSNRFDLNRDLILENVYRQPRPNRYLAQFGKFIFQNQKEPYCSRLVFDAFTLFLVKYVKRYPQWKEARVHFSGSIAFYFADLLRKAAKNQDIRIGNIVENPIAGLTLYHQNKEE